jgi:hypothetical protein
MSIQSLFAHCHFPFPQGPCVESTAGSVAVNQGNWTVARNGNPAMNTGPTNDHTQSSTIGMYAVVTKATNDTGKKVFRINSPMYNQAGKTCQFSLWYNVHGHGFTQFRILIHSGGRESQLYAFMAGLPFLATVQFP